MASALHWINVADDFVHEHKRRMQQTARDAQRQEPRFGLYSVSRENRINRQTKLLEFIYENVPFLRVKPKQCYCFFVNDAVNRLFYYKATITSE